MKEINSLKHWVELYRRVENAVEELEVMYEFYEEGDVPEEEVEAQYARTIEVFEDVEFRTTLNQPEDEMSAIMEINAGAGGTEANDWAEMIMRMFLMYADKHGYKVTELSRQDGDVVGIKSVSLEIDGDYAFGMLKSENGVHRLVRVSPFNAQGKRMTSFASVFVHPMINQDIEVEINPADLEWDTFRASGAGGQHVNKTDSAVRVRHLPTGLVAECQQERSQHMNREKALQMLRSKIYEMEMEKQRAEKEKIESGKSKNEWGSQIRSYVLDDRRVKDHRTGYETRNPENVLDGGLDDFIKAFLMEN